MPSLRPLIATPLLLLASAIGAQEAPAPSPPQEPLPGAITGACLPFPLEPLTSPAADALPLARLSGRAPLTPGFVRRPSADWGTPVCQTAARLQHSGASRLPSGVEPRLRLLPVRTRAVHNSGYPDDRNDGAVWAGRGWSATTEAGAAARWGPFSAALYPTVAYQENRAFQLREVPEPFSRFHNPFYGASIDLPQRFGPDHFWSLDPGQSFLRADVYGVAAGVSTENLWWGPGRHYSLLMSSTAPGFPHAFLGTSGPVETWIGRFDAQLVWGHLRASDYIAPDMADRRLLMGMILGFEPRGLPGLSLGLGRVYVQPGDALGVSDYLPFLDPFLKQDLITPDDPDPNDPDNQLAAIYARWVLPESDFEVYGSWGRDDHSWDFEDLVEEPDHSQAYLLGFQKLAGVGDMRLRIAGELVHLQENRPSITSRGTPIWYLHHQSYTNGGQMLGSFTGPGSDAQMLAADLLTGRGLVGIHVERVRRNDFSAAARAARAEWPLDHDVELTVGGRAVYFRGPLAMSVGGSFSRRYNRDFISVADGSGFVDGSSARLVLGGTWRP